MRFLFICGSLESGRDGVGDYTMALCCLLQRNHHECHIVAYSDQYCDCVTKREEAGVITHRFPKNLHRKEKLQRLEQIASEFQPNLVSLQFVAYGFHPKGISWQLGANLRACLKELPVHIMFHEIWVGAERDSRLKHRVVGAAQKLAHRRLVSYLQPFCVHTHAEPYRRALMDLGVEARPLPLPSNLPRAVDPDFGFVRDRLSASAIKTEVAENVELAVFLVFGHIPPEWEAEILLRQLETYQNRSGRKPVLFFCGRGGLDENRRRQLWALAGKYRVTCVSEGFLPPQEVSSVMQFADFGVATVPFALWQKSGVVAAMRTHGLPVIFTRFDGDWPKKWLPPWPEGFLRCDGALATNLATSNKTPFRDFWPETTKTFLSDCTILDTRKNTA